MVTVVALYDTMDQAEQAVRDLKNSGFDSSNIGLLASNVNGYYNTKGNGASATATGATAGAVVGGIGGLLVGLGALVIPGIGPVIAAGPLAVAFSTLVGAGVGAAAGGVLGALVDLGIPKDEAGYYAEGVRRGGALVTAQVDDKRDAEARTILQRYSPVNVNERATAWKQSGWTGYDAKAQPYTADQIEAERQRYSTPTPTMSSR